MRDLKKQTGQCHAAVVNFGESVKSSSTEEFLLCAVKRKK